LLVTQRDDATEVRVKTAVSDLLYTRLPVLFVDFAE
jgi:hypothetical protein